MEFIHDFTGSVSTFAAYALGISGVAIYFFKHVRKWLPLERKNLVKGHLFASMLLITMLLFHYLTTNKSNYYVMLAVAGYLAIVLLGLSIRVKSIKSRFYKKIVALKVAVLTFVIVMTLVGHSIFEKEKHEHEEHSALIIK